MSCMEIKCLILRTSTHKEKEEYNEQLLVNLKESKMWPDSINKVRRLARGGGGVLGYILGGYVPPGSPNLDPVLERICTQNDTPF